MKEKMGELYEAGPELSEIYANGLSLSEKIRSDMSEEEKIKKVIKSRLPDVIYIEDLVSAVFYALTQEIPGKAPFHQDALDSLKKFLTVVMKVSTFQHLLRRDLLSNCKSMFFKDNFPSI